MHAASFEFAQFQVDAGRRTLTREGSEIVLSRKAFDTLVVLLEENGRLVTKDALIKRVWPDSFVEENSLNQSISTLRKALGDPTGGPKFIETVSGRGYRFVAPIVARAPRESGRTLRSLAVLPLRNLGAEDGDCLGIGIADTLISRLSTLRDLAVRPTSAVLRFASGHHDPVETGRSLGVDAILEGNIRKAGDRLRASVQLVSVESGAPIWARAFDEQFTEIFAVEDAISQRVAEALTSRLSGDERSHLTRRTTENSEAYRLYLNGHWYADRLTRDSLTKSEEFLQQAVALDPDYAQGYAGLAYHFVQCADLTIPSREALTRAEEAARRALAIDGARVDAHAVIATVLWMRDWDRAASLRAFADALAIDPHDVNALRLHGWCLTLMGEFDRALAELRKTLDMEPLSQANTLYYIPALYFARRYDESLVAMRDAIARDPNLWLTHVIAGRALEAKGDLAGAIESYERSRDTDDSIPENLGDLGRAVARAGDAKRARAILDELQQYSYVPAFVAANIHLGLGDRDRTFELMEAAIEERSWYVTWYPIDPMLDELRGDPRFATLLAAPCGTILPARAPRRS